MKMHAPMLMPVTGLIAGITASIYGVSLLAAGALALTGCLTYIILLKLSRNPVRAFRINRYHYIWVFLIFSAIGVFSADINKPWETDNPKLYIAAGGHVKSITQSTHGDRLSVKVNELISRNGNVLKPYDLTILVNSDAVEAEVDDNIYLPVNLSKIVNSDNYFKSGYAESMYRKGILYETNADGKNIVKSSHSTTFNGIAHKIRNNIEEFIEKTPLTKETQNFLITILLGDRSYLDRNIRYNFADTGISHILALSGMHMAIISGIILWLLFPLNFFGRYKLRLILSVVILFFYAFITGWGASTLRATLMMTSVLLCILLERKNSSWNSLLTATFIILAFNPYALTDIGLQLSFLCVASLIFFVQPTIPFDRHEHPNLYKLSATIITTLAATLGTWCISAYYFGTVPVMFLPANLIILPILPCYLVIAIIYFIFLAVGLDISMIGALLDHGYDLMRVLIDKLTNSGNSAVMFTPSITSVIVWTGFAVCIAMWLNGKKSKLNKYSCVLFACGFIISIAFTSDAGNEDSYIIQKGIGPVNILTRTNGTEHLYKMDRYSITQCRISGHDILTIDAPVKGMGNDSLKEFDAVILAGGCRDDLTEVLTKIKPATIIIHPTVRRHREKKIMEIADSLGLDCHSIRESGPYRRILKK